MAHGVIHPILLPAVMRYNLDFAPEKMRQLGKVILQEERTSATTSIEGINRLEHFFATLGINTSLHKETGEQAKGLLGWNELLSICEEVW